MSRPALVVLSSLFPSEPRPTAGVFIRERMFRVARELPLAVVSPQPWFPGQALIRCVSPGYRLAGALHEQIQGIDVFRPRALSLPGIARHWDARAMAVAALPTIRGLRRDGRCDIIDAHFAYPDGCAAAQLSRWLGVPYTITMRGTEPRHLASNRLRPQIVRALSGAARVFCVSASLREVAAGAGVNCNHFSIVGNGVDSTVFRPIDRRMARAALGLPDGVPILVTVGALVERKGFHRVIALLPRLKERHPGLVYLAVGGESPEGDWTERLKRQVATLGLGDCVRFLGTRSPADLHVPMSAANIFILASSNEGWANVILEAMACGLPVVASDVGGNAEVVVDPACGLIYPFGDDEALFSCLDRALTQAWSRERLLHYARQNSWDCRVAQLVATFRAIAAEGALKANERCDKVSPSRMPR